jgi:predicted nucleic acid-binding OB-fold protein
VNRIGSFLNFENNGHSVRCHNFHSTTIASSVINAVPKPLFTVRDLDEENDINRFILRLEDLTADASTPKQELKIIIEKKLTDEFIGQLNSIETFNKAMRCLSILKFEFSHNKVLLNKMIKRFSTFPFRVTPNALNGFLFSLPSFGYTWQTIEKESIAGLHRRFVDVMMPARKSWQPEPAAFRWFLVDINKLGVVWIDLPKEVNDAILNAFIHNISKINLKNGGAMCISVFGQLGFKLTNTRDFFIKDLNEVIEALLVELDDEQDVKQANLWLSSILTGMSRMGFVYADLSPTLQNTLKNVVEKHITKLDQISVATLLLT